MSQPKQVRVVSVDARRAGQGMEPTAFFDEDGQPIEFGGGGSVAWGDVTGKPSTFAPAAHEHAADDVSSGTFAAARIPSLAISKITGLQAKITEIEGRLDALEADTE